MASRMFMSSLLSTTAVVRQIAVAAYGRATAMDKRKTTSASAEKYGVRRVNRQPREHPRHALRDRPRDNEGGSADGDPFMQPGGTHDNARHRPEGQPSTTVAPVQDFSASA